MKPVPFRSTVKEIALLINKLSSRKISLLTARISYSIQFI